MPGFCPVFLILSPLPPLHLVFFCLRHRNEFVHKTAMSKRIHPFCSHVILMRFVFSSFWSWSRAFVGINNTSVFCPAFPNIAVGFTHALYRYVARHCCWHRNFQLSTSGFHCEHEFFVVWFNEEYASHLSGVFELCFLFCCIEHKVPRIWPYIIRTRGYLFPRKSPTRTMYIRQVAFRSLFEPCESCPCIRQFFMLHPSSSNLQSVFQTIHPVTYMSFWKRRCASLE